MKNLPFLIWWVFFFWEWLLKREKSVCLSRVQAERETQRCKDSDKDVGTAGPSCGGAKKWCAFALCPPSLSACP